MIAKPDLVATDGGANTFFGSPPGRRLALLRHLGRGTARGRGRGAGAPGQSRRLRRAGAGRRSTSTARPVGAFGPTAVGAGLVDAYGAVAALALPPTITITKAPAPLSRNRRPTIEFSANRPVTFTCEVDGGPAQPCASPFVVPAALADGSHGIAVSGVDLAGRSGASGAAGFAIDTRAPRTVSPSTRRS